MTDEIITLVSCDDIGEMADFRPRKCNTQKIFIKGDGFKTKMVSDRYLEDGTWEITIGIDEPVYKRSKWIKIDKSSPYPILEAPFLTLDEYDTIGVGFTAFDYYDSEYWAPAPELPSKAYILQKKWAENVVA